jgi:hypothetical protein
MRSQMARKAGARKAIEFFWQRHLHHEWIADGRPMNEPRAPKGKHLIASGIAGAEGYKPLENATGLFKNFSLLDPHETAIKAFAHKYGMLGIGEPLIHGKSMVRGERFEDWANCIHEMRRAVELWDAVKAYKAGSQRDLRRLIEWRDPNSVQYHDGKSSGAWIAAKVMDLNVELLDSMPYPELVQPAMHYLQRLANENQRKYPSGTKLVWTRGELRIFIWPPNLIAAMWLQFALAIDGDRQYRTCEECGRWFEVGGGIKRMDSETCDTSCRKRRQNRNRSQ